MNQRLSDLYTRNESKVDPRPVSLRYSEKIKRLSTTYLLINVRPLMTKMYVCLFCVPALTKDKKFFKQNCIQDDH